jgi:putative FmdB family regulatory protein
MPLYEYACEKCGKVFEVIEKFSDQPLTVHAECGGKVERLLSAPALHFKGSGFYITDYAKGNGNANAPKSSENKKSETKTSSEGSKTESSSTPASPAPATTSTSSDSK